MNQKGNRGDGGVVEGEGDGGESHGGEVEGGKLRESLPTGSSIESGGKREPRVCTAAGAGEKRNV